MADPEVARQSADVLLKWTATAFRSALIERFGLDIPDIIQGLPTELPVLEVRTELADGRILHVEFQLTSRSDDLVRFLAYAVALYRRHHRHVVTVVFYGPDVRNAPTELDAGAFATACRIST